MSNLKRVIKVNDGVEIFLMSNLKRVIKVHGGVEIFLMSNLKRVIKIHKKMFLIRRLPSLFNFGEN